MTTYPDTTPDWDIRLLKGNVVNDWRQVNDAYLDVDAAITRATHNATFSGATLLDPIIRDELRFGPEGAGAPDAFLRRLSASALRTDSNLGVGVAPAGWGAGAPALQAGVDGALWGATAASGVNLSVATYYDGTAHKALTSNPASKLTMGQGILTYLTAPSVAAGASQTFTNRLQVAQNGTVAVVPDAGAAALDAAGHVNVRGAAGIVLFEGAGVGNVHFSNAVPGGGGLVFVWGSQDKLAMNSNSLFPTTPSGMNLGAASNPWNIVYASTGTIQPSSRAVKEEVVPLAPAEAMAAVRVTEAVRFTYRTPAPPAPIRLPTRGFDWKAERLRMLERPLLAAARTQHGFLAEQADPLFLTGQGQANPSNTAGVLLAALQDVDRRLTALEEGGA